MRRIRLDRIDRRILRHLLMDGRMTNVELARRAGISAPPCLRRVRALEEAGIIRGYHADLAPEALGYAVTVFAQVGLSSQADADLKAFEQLVATWPEVREAYMLAGETDLGADREPCQIGANAASLKARSGNPDFRAADDDRVAPSAESDGDDLVGFGAARGCDLDTAAF